MPNDNRPGRADIVTKLGNQVTTARDFMFSRPDRVGEHRFEGAGRADLFVLTTLFNPIRHRTRWKNYQDFQKRLIDTPGVIRCVVEIAQRARDFVVGSEKDPVPPDILLQLETTSELWLKEVALNLLAQRLPITWQYLAFVDADIRFARDDWANETVQQLQHYKVLQMWSEMVDLGPDYEILSTIKSIIWNWQNGKFGSGHGHYYYYAGKPGYPGAPGLAWAWRRDAWDEVGGLIDHAIVGAGDSYMAFALMGELKNTLRKRLTDGYKDPIYRWQDRAERHIKRLVGLMPGLALHFFHGPKVHRRYGTREDILIETKFDPATDLKRDWQNLYQLVVESDRQRILRDRLMQYFRQRKEDGTEP